MSIVYHVVTGSATPATGTPSEWPAAATFVRIAPDSNGNVDIYASMGGVANGHRVVVRNPTTSSATVYNIEGDVHLIPAGQCREYVYDHGRWCRL